MYGERVKRQQATRHDIKPGGASSSVTKQDQTSPSFWRRTVPLIWAINMENVDFIKASQTPTTTPHPEREANRDTKERDDIIRKARSLFLVLFFVFGAMLGGTVAVFYRSEINTRESTLTSQERYSITLQGIVMGEVFKTIVSDLHFLAGQNELNAFLESGNAADRSAMIGEYLRMAAVKGLYDQIRFLDESGAEVVRVNDNQGLPDVVPASQLQNKAKRYYFADSFSLDPGEVFVSPLDLNVEQGEVERPLKPMIRFGTPVFDAQGRKRGIVLLNYLAKNLLQRIVETGVLSTGSPMLLNSDGYWLLSPSKNDEWGFMFKERSGHSFANRFPGEWAEILKDKKGQIQTEEGIFTYDTIYPLQEGLKSSTGSGKAYAPSTGQLGHDNYFWIILSHVSPEILRDYSWNLLVKLFLLGAGLFVAVAAGAWGLALTIVRRRLHRVELEAQAHYDGLTRLPNRTLFFDRLNQALSAASRHHRGFALLYVDLDGFKRVNDTIGHKAGDELLMHVATLLSNCCRKSDTVARLGGDEFAILLNEVSNQTGPTLVAKKIIQSLADPISVFGGEAIVGASIGISLFPENGSDADLLLQRADEAMYISKKNGKNTHTCWKQEYSGAAGSAA